MKTVFGLDPATWQPHLLHHEDRAFTETNCYLDVLIELVAATGAEPRAMLGGAAAIDFETDQWTFFKPSGDEMRRLYGMEIHEMQPYRPLPDLIAARLDVGQTVIPELDSFYLPDTATSSYRTEHVKSSVVAESIDTDAEVFRYFHNAGYYELSGADYRGALRLDPVPAAQVLPPYVDLVRFDAGPVLADVELRDAAWEMLRSALQRRPYDNPIARFGEQLQAALPGLLEGDLASYHSYAFATARMLGASAEMLIDHVRWLDHESADSVAEPLEQVVSGSKMLIFRMARRRTFDVDGVCEPMAAHWQAAQDALEKLAS